MGQKGKEHDPAYGLWIVSTEGDCEGRTTRQLGSYVGYIDEIAQALTDEVEYVLQFKRAKPLPKTKSGKKRVQIKGEWGTEPNDLADLLKNRPVSTKKGSSYKAITIVFNEKTC